MLPNSIPDTWPTKGHFGTVWVSRREHPSLTHNFKKKTQQGIPQMVDASERVLEEVKLYNIVKVFGGWKFHLPGGGVTRAPPPK